MLATSFGFGTAMRPGEAVADTVNPDKLFRCVGDTLLTDEGLLGMYLGRTKNNRRAWALNLVQYVLDVFICYLSEYMLTVPDFCETSPLFVGKWTPDKDRYQQISTAELRAFIRYMLVEAGVCNEEEAMRHTAYSMRPGLVTALRQAGIPDYAIMLWTRHHSRAMERYDRPTPAMLLENIKRIYDEAQRTGKTSPHMMVKRWLKESACEKRQRDPEELIGMATGLPAPAQGAQKILLLSRQEAEKVRRSKSGCPLQLDHTSSSLSTFLRLKAKGPDCVGFFTDRDWPLVTKLPTKKNPGKGQTLGKITVHPMKGGARDRWLSRHKGKSKDDVLQAGARLRDAFMAQVAALPLPLTLKPVSLADSLASPDLQRGQVTQTDSSDGQPSVAPPKSCPSSQPVKTARVVEHSPQKPPPKVATREGSPPLDRTPPWGPSRSSTPNPPPLANRPTATAPYDVSDVLQISPVPPPPPDKYGYKMLTWRSPRGVTWGDWEITPHGP
ncbi:MAG: hypothetical protein CMJ95_14320 [Planctomycetes bacterium]|nr:hypothetical protein [Planctomycetota bacterium]